MRRESIMPLLAVVLFVGLSGCGGSHNSSSEASDQQRSERVSQSKVPLNDRVNAAKNGTLFCQFHDECEPALVMISVVTDEGIERCSGFLISENQVVTNDHCVSKSTAVAGALKQSSNIPCDGLIYIHFAKAGGGSQAQHVSCQSIQTRSFERGIGSKDYAIIKLATPVRDRAPLKLAARGFAANEQANIFRVQMDQNPTTKTFDGLQTKLECQASYGTMLYPGVTSSDSPLMTFGDCAIQAGNSGSPALNSSGEVGAIIQGYLSVKQDEKILNELKERLLDESYGQIGIGTQVECIPELNLSRAGRCGSIVNMKGLMPKEFVETAGEFNSSVLPAVPTDETWKSLPASSADDKAFAKVPQCINSNVVNNGYASLVKSYRRGLNRFLQPEWRSRIEDQTYVNLSIAPGTKIDIASSTVQGPMVDLTSRELGIISLPVCKDAILTL